MPAPGEPDPRFGTYLCSYCNQMFTALAGSIDRTRFVRCPVCETGDSPWAFGVRYAQWPGYMSDPTNTVRS